MIGVLKVGGAAASPAAHVAAIRDRGDAVALVHGGGPRISAMCRDRGIEPVFVDGQRVTDGAVLAVVGAALAQENARLVADLRQAGVEAAGVVGALVAAPLGDTRLGLVGRVEHVRCAPIDELLADGCVPVVNPFAGLNVNADHAAAAVAVALGADQLAFLSDVPGVLDPGGGVIRRIAADEVAGLVAQGTVAGGMLPKLAAGVHAARGGVWRVWIGSETLVTV
ncbi:MAG: acetylglutamate kinase [Gaiellales bacterium]